MTIITNVTGTQFTTSFEWKILCQVIVYIADYARTHI